MQDLTNEKIEMKAYEFQELINAILPRPLIHLKHMWRNDGTEMYVGVLGPTGYHSCTISRHSLDLFGSEGEGPRRLVSYESSEYAIVTEVTEDVLLIFRALARLSTT